MKRAGFLPLVSCILFLASLSLAEPTNIQATRLLTESKVAHAVIVGTRLLVVYGNGSLIAYELPGLANAKKLLTLRGVEIAGLGPLNENVAVLVFMNGTAVALSIEDGTRLWSAQLVENYPIKSATVNGRWVAAIVKYSLGSYEADRILIFDCLRRAVVYRIDKNGDSRLIYAFNIKIAGSLLLITGIDTTCSLCKMTDTYVLVYNLSQLRRIFAVRPGACLSDLSGNTLVIAKIGEGTGYYYDLEKGLEAEFKVDGAVVDIRVYGGRGYVLSQNGSGVFLSRIEGGKVYTVGRYEEGSRVLLLDGVPAVIGKSSIYLGTSKMPVRTLLPLRSSTLLEYENGVVLIYGEDLIYSIYSVKEPSLIVVTEPTTLVEVPELRVEGFANSSGLAALNLPPGLYNIFFTKEGYERSYTLVEIDPSKTVKVISVKLAPAKRNHCTVLLKVIDDETKQPIPYTLNVTLIGGFASPVTEQFQAEEGSLELNLICQEEYTLLVSARGYAEWKGKIHAEVNGSPVTLSLKRRDQTSPLATQPLDQNTLLNMAKVVENLVAVPGKVNNTRAGVGEVLDIDGQAIDLSNGVKVLVFFYTKCPGCKVLLTGLKSMDAGNVSIVLISPSIYDSVSTLKEFRSEWVSTWHYVLDENTALTKAFNVSHFPTVVLLENGVIRFIGVGARGEAEWMAGEIANLLEDSINTVRDPATLSALIGALMLVAVEIERRREFKEGINK